MHNALNSGQPFPQVDLPKLGGGKLTLGRPASAEWQLVFVYRGLHCPICKGYLTELQGKLSEFSETGIEVVVVSGDPEPKAARMVEETGLTAPMGHDLTVPQMRWRSAKFLVAILPAELLFVTFWRPTVESP